MHGSPRLFQLSYFLASMAQGTLCTSSQFLCWRVQDLQHACGFATDHFACFFYNVMNITLFRKQWLGNECILTYKIAINQQTLLLIQHPV